MPHKGKVLSASFFLVVLLLLATTTGWTAVIRDGDPGTIGAVLAQSDGTTVTLTSEQVLWQGRSGKSFAIKEWFEKQPPQPRLVIVSTHRLLVQEFWTVDVTGVLSTLPGTSKDGSAIRQRVLIVIPDSVSVYCDPRGKPFLFPGLKGMGMEWANKRTLSELAGESTAQSASMSTMDAGTLPPMEDSPDSEPTPPAPGSRDSVKWLPNFVNVALNGAIVSAVTPDSFYIETSDRSFGIWVYPSQSTVVEPGWLVNIFGYMTGTDAERAVMADSVTHVDTSNTYPLPRELGMPNKVLGGGAVGLYTPPVADATGLNNTGLLVRVWGKVKYVDTQNRIFYIDDGSGVNADAGQVGVKVYDTTNDTLPALDSYQIVSGVSRAEAPQEATASIRTLWKTPPVIPSTQAGTTATITGNVTAQGADGKTVRVYCGSASTTATFSGNTASYTLHPPAGTHAVTATAVGYKTATQRVSVSNNQTASCNFTLSALQEVIDVVPAQTRIAPDGTSQTVVTAIVRDEEGRRIPGEIINWVASHGTISPAQSTADNVGEATATLTSSTDHVTGIVWAESANAVGGAYVEFANPGDPSIIITDPVGGEVSGFIPVRVSTSDADSDALPHSQLFVDGLPRGSIVTNEYRLSGLDTSQLSNGWHTLTAKATDDDLHTMWSQEVDIYVSNDISQVDYSSEIFTDESVPGTITFSAQMNTIGTWSVEVRNYQNNTLAYSTSGIGPGAIQSSWDGKINGSYVPGIYKVIVSTQSSGGQFTAQATTTREYDVTISQANASMLICGKLRGEEDWSRAASIDEMIAVADACRAQGVTYTLLADPLWVDDDNDPNLPYGADTNQNGRLRLGFKAWINKGYHNFFYSTHGNTEFRNGKWRSSILFDSTLGQAWVYGDDYDWTPQQRPVITAFSDLDIWPDQFRIVQINACWSGGNYLRGADTSIPNAFGNYGAVENEQTYLGWMFYYYPSGSPIAEGLSPNGTQWTKEFWRFLGMGYTVNQAQQMVFIRGNYTGWMHNFLWTYGGDWVTYLTSW